MLSGMLSIEEISACGIIPVVVLNDADAAVPTARALLRGGIDVMEITFRTAAAQASIARVTAEVPEMKVGAGTVVTVQQARDAVAAGAKFLVSPGSDADIIREAAALNTPIVPGVVTPSEIMLGLKLGVKVFKFFPAESYGGLKTIKALSGPFPQIKFIPTGGINQENAGEYFKNPKIQAVGGSWMVSAKMIEAGEFDAIADKSAAATALFQQLRG
ncbi:MAG: bifunctional 4-hydroxy-2-oxoglutarate aldolase/2-dehydro-3-deoxy-phosphogluconate aldolase [Clostridia bacterium]|nr:bifunctional 4-hydroxy-2-oxoglutarate aldolase/2-dehydro-3-deoxy-phosphogluconate aldolase [Clostridia bacterium]